MSESRNAESKGKPKTRKLRAVLVKAEDAHEGVTMIRVQRRVLAFFNQARKADKLTISDALEQMVIAYVEKLHPDWKMSFEQDAKSKTDES